MPETPPVTGSMLHDLVACERRVHHDLHTDAALRDPVSAFVQMLWRGGRDHESAVLSGLDGQVADLRRIPLGERTAATAAAIASQADLILGGRLDLDDLVGMPDLIRCEHDGWTAGDVKSGGAFEADGTTPRRQYAAQVGLYALLLGRLGLGRDDRAFVIARDGAAVDFDLKASRGRNGVSIADATTSLIAHARGIRDGAIPTRGALSADCKMCHWHSVCERELVAADDPTLLAGVGRAVRDALLPIAPTVGAVALLDVAALDFGCGKSPVRGVGVERLERFAARARLMVAGGAPYAIRPLGLARNARELHLDLETDPSRDGLVYLHGVLDRRDDGSKRYHSFFAETEGEERDAFANTLTFLNEDPSAIIYYYSKFERSTYRALQRRHPEVCTASEIETLFHPDRAIDLLFDVIAPHTEWPTRNLSIKTIARHLGFDWRDADASGANSIAWYDDYRRTRDAAIRQRILDYNEDDVLASVAVLDGLIGLPVLPAVRR